MHLVLPRFLQYCLNNAGGNRESVYVRYEIDTDARDLRKFCTPIPQHPGTGIPSITLPGVFVFVPYGLDTGTPQCGQLGILVDTDTTS